MVAATSSGGAPAATLYVREAGGLTAEAPLLPCSASLFSTASGPGRVLQRRGNSGTFGSRPGSFGVLYRTTQFKRDDVRRPKIKNLRCDMLLRTTWRPHGSY